MGDIEMSSLSLDEYIKKSGNKGGRGRNTGRRSGTGGIQKPKRPWDNDKLKSRNPRRNSGGGGGARLSASGKAIARLSNVPYNVSEEELNDLFAEFRLSKVSLHYDFRGRSLGTAEVQGPANVIQRLAREFKNVEIDGRPLDIQVVGQRSSSSLTGRAAPRIQRRQTSGRGDSRRNNRGGVGKADGKKKLTAEELDKELDEYMQSSKNT